MTVKATKYLGIHNDGELREILEVKWVKIFLEVTEGGWSEMPKVFIFIFKTHLIY
jgi:hypothetical protein